MLLQADEAKLITVRQVGHGDGKWRVATSLVLAKTAKISQMSKIITESTDIGIGNFVLTKKLPSRNATDERLRKIGADFTKKEDILVPDSTIASSGLANIVYIV